MKKLSFFTLAAAGMLLAACSSEDIAGEQSPVIDTQGDSYVGIAIELPNATTPTRANDELNNGTEDEFAVKNADLYLFKGNDQYTATYIGRWSLENDFKNDTEGATTDAKPQENETRVTTTSVSVAKIEDLTLLPSEDIYAYVVINGSIGDLEADKSFKEFSETVFTYAQLGADVNGNISENGMLMTNSPIAETAGGSNASTGNIVAAYKLDKAKIAKTEEDAKKTPAGCIYVERAAAKVTIAEGAGLGDEMTYNESEKMKFEIDGWQIINYAPSYYNVRQTDFPEWLGYNSEYATNANTKYRFVSLQQFSPTLPSTANHTTAYRTYFAKDLTYDADATGLLRPVASTTETDWLKKDGKAYVTENTFDVEHQTHQNTTMVTLRVKFNEGKDFYSINNDADLYAVADINATLATKVQNLYGIKAWQKKVADYIVDELKKKDATKTHTAEVAFTADVPENATAVAGKQAYTVSYKITAKTDGTEVAESEIPALSEELTNEWNTAKEKAEADFTVTLYKGGLSYYNVRIQHFGDAETPWSKDGEYTTQPGETVDQIYGAAADDAAKTLRNNRFLGRYGIVRDNWYNLSVNSIKKLGSATPEDVSADATPDDQIDEEYYISVHVHILPWVLRTQNINL